MQAQVVDITELWKLTRNRIVRSVIYRLARIGIRYTSAIMGMVDLRNHVYQEKGPRRRPDVSVKVCGVDDVDRMRVLDDKQRKTIREKINRGHVMIAAFVREELAGYSWLTFPNLEAYLPEIDRYMKFDGAYGHDMFTLPAFRRQGIAKLLHTASMDIARARKCDRIYGLTETDNAPQRRNLQSLPDVSIKKIYYFRFFKWRKYIEIPLIPPIPDKNQHDGL